MKGETKQEAINFANWILKSEWIMREGEWQLRKGRMTFGALERVATTEELFCIYKGENPHKK